MPANDGTSRVWYMILENIEGKIKYTHRYLNYNYKQASSLMEENNLPIEYTKTLISGIWDNMEILPKIEKELQGIPYDFETITKEYQTIKK